MSLANLLMDAGYACIPLGLAIVGERRKLGWTVGLIGQMFVVGYGIAAMHPWMVLMPSICASIQIRHLIIWRHETWERIQPPAAPTVDPSRERLATSEEIQEIFNCDSKKWARSRRLARYSHASSSAQSAYLCAASSSSRSGG
jgi:hypothetical protein